MLIDPGQEKHIALKAQFVPRKEIRQHLFVRMPQMRRAVHVINRCGEKIRTCHAPTLPTPAFLAIPNVAEVIDRRLAY